VAHTSPAATFTERRISRIRISWAWKMVVWKTETGSPSFVFYCACELVVSDGSVNKKEYTEFEVNAQRLKSRLKTDFIKFY
jgi:hypothetical protein